MTTGPYRRRSVCLCSFKPRYAWTYRSFPRVSGQHLAMSRPPHPAMNLPCRGCKQPVRLAVGSTPPVPCPADHSSLVPHMSTVGRPSQKLQPDDRWQLRSIPADRHCQSNPCFRASSAGLPTKQSLPWGKNGHRGALPVPHMGQCWRAQGLRGRDGDWLGLSTLGHHTSPG